MNVLPEGEAQNTLWKIHTIFIHYRNMTLKDKEYIRDLIEALTNSIPKLRQEIYLRYENGKSW
jgi:hypothetical protein